MFSTSPEIQTLHAGGGNIVAPAVVPEAPARGRAALTLTLCPRAGESTARVFARLARELAAREAELLGLMIYGDVSAPEETHRAMRAALGEPRWPVTWTEGASCDGAPLAGVQAFAIGRGPVTRVRLGGAIVGSVYEEAGAKFCLLGGLGPTARTLAPAAQVQQTFGNLEEALALAGFELGDVVRTWFYNADILSWYREFNRVRSALYAGVKWRTGSLPASTGIGALNPAGAALTLGALAMRPIDAEAGAREIGSPLQCPAPAYGSAFSRAMEVRTRDTRRLLVSGTASIRPGGETAWVGDARRQVELTLEVVGAILKSREMDFADATRATAYYRTASDRVHFEAWLAARGLALPVVHTRSVICRDDLLFELELDAARALR